MMLSAPVSECSHFAMMNLRWQSIGSCGVQAGPRPSPITVVEQTGVRHVKRRMGERFSRAEQIAHATQLRTAIAASAGT
jgi:hypothetical protein